MKIPEPTMFNAQITTHGDTVEERILSRHIREMLYNILLCSHYKIKQRKNECMNEMVNAFLSNVKQNLDEIIAKYLPNNTQDMKIIVNEIFDEIVQKH